MGIRFQCPNGHPIHVKSFLAGKRGICPHCEAKFIIPQESGGQAPPAPRKKRHSWSDDGASESMPPDQQTPDGTDAPAPTGGAAFAQPSGNGIQLNAPVSLPSEQGRLPQDSARAAPVAHTPAVAGASPAQPIQPAAPVNPAAPAGADPIAEAPQAMWYVRPPTGGQFGPAAGEILRRWIGEGRVSADSMVWREGWAEWRQAGQALPQLRGVVHPAPAAPAAVFGDPAAIAVKPGGGSGPARRRKSNSMTVAIVVVMILLAIVLAAIFAWVLNKQDAPAESGQATARATRVHDRDIMLAPTGRSDFHRASAAGCQLSAVGKISPLEAESRQPMPRYQTVSISLDG